MRATQRTTFPSLRLLGALVLAVSGFAACADAIHLDPPGTGGSTTQTGAGGSGCRSNPECAYPKPVCDTVTAKCVECLVVSDCAGKPSTVCSLGSCVCPAADGSAALTYCPGETPACVDTQTSPTNCGGCDMPCPTGCLMGSCTAGTGGTGGAGTGGSTNPDDAGDDGG